MSLSLVWAIHRIIYALKKIFICAGPISGTRFDTIYFGRDLDRGWGWWDDMVKKTTEWVDKGVKEVEKGVNTIKDGASDVLDDIGNGISDAWDGFVDDLEQIKFINETIHTIEFGAKVAQAIAKCQNLASASTVLNKIRKDAVAVIKPILDKGNLKQQVENGAINDVLTGLFNRNVDHVQELLHCLDDVVLLDRALPAISISVAPQGSMYTYKYFFIFSSANISIIFYQNSNISF